MATTSAPVTNDDFAAAVGVHFTTASKLRNGQRKPSLSLLHRIHEAYGISLELLVTTANEGAEAFGALLRKRVFRDG